MLSKTKGVISKRLDTKIEFETIKPFVNFDLKILLDHLYIFINYY